MEGDGNPELLEAFKAKVVEAMGLMTQLQNSPRKIEAMQMMQQLAAGHFVNADSEMATVSSANTEVAETSSEPATSKTDPGSVHTQVANNADNTPKEFIVAIVDSDSPIQLQDVVEAEYEDTEETVESLGLTDLQSDKVAECSMKDTSVDTADLPPDASKERTSANSSVRANKKGRPRARGRGYTRSPVHENPSSKILRTPTQNIVITEIKDEDPPIEEITTEFPEAKKRKVKKEERVEDVKKENDAVPPDEDGNQIVANIDASDPEYKPVQRLLERPKRESSRGRTKGGRGAWRREIMERSFPCTDCGKVLCSMASLAAHQRVHTGEKPFLCVTCNAQFSTKGNMLRHLRTHTGEKPFQCPQCLKCFTEKKSVDIHMRIHTGEKPYSCQTCGKCFNQLGILQGHMLLHKGRENFMCEICGKGFPQKSQLRCHLVRHSGVRPHQCKACGSSFVTRSDLDRHKRVHTGERPFICDLCGKSFTRQQNLREHMNRHNNIMPYKCTYCNRSYPEMSACYKHIKSHVKAENNQIVTEEQVAEQRKRINELVSQTVDASSHAMPLPYQTITRSEAEVEHQVHHEVPPQHQLIHEHQLLPDQHISLMPDPHSSNIIITTADGTELETAAQIEVIQGQHHHKPSFIPVSNHEGTVIMLENHPGLPEEQYIAVQTITEQDGSILHVQHHDQDVDYAAINLLASASLASYHDQEQHGMQHYTSGAPS